MAWIEVPLGTQKTTDKFCGGYLNNVDTNASGGVVTSNYEYVLEQSLILKDHSIYSLYKCCHENWGGILQPSIIYV